MTATSQLKKWQGKLIHAVVGHLGKKRTSLAASGWERTPDSMSAISTVAETTCGKSRRWPACGTLGRNCDLIDRLVRGSKKEDRSRVTSAPGSWLRLRAASLATSIALGHLRANVLQEYPLLKAIGSVCVLDTHRRGIHPLDEPLAIGVREFDNAGTFGALRAVQARKGAVAKRTPRHRSSAESSLQESGFAQLPSLGALVKVASE